MLDPCAEHTGQSIRYLEQRGRLDLAGALRLASPVLGGAPCLVHRATGFSTSRSGESLIA